MKKSTKIIIVLAILAIFPLAFGILMSEWNVSTQTRANLTDNQINQISEALKFELAPNETIQVSFFPGFIQAMPSLTVAIENIESEDDFLSRFSGEITDTGGIELFQFERTPKDYHSKLEFIETDGVLSAVFNINGSVPQLREIYHFSYNPYIKYMNVFVILPLTVQLIFVVLLIVQFVKYLRKKMTEG
jgi:hypothetical protein